MVLKHHDDVDKQCKVLCTLIAGDYDSPLLNAVWMMFQAYVDTAAALIGDPGFAPGENWLSWYIWENDCGKREFTMNAQGFTTKRICNVDDLIEAMERSKAAGGTQESKWMPC